MRAPAWYLVLGSCTPAPPAAPAAPPVRPVVSVSAPWVVIEETASHLALRHGASSEGVRVQLATGADGRTPGVTPVHGGRALELRRAGGQVVPAFAPPWSVSSAAYLESQGPDLLVRLEGPPIDAWSDHPQAPADPLLSWVRLRVRADGTWRIVLRGLHDVTLPGATRVDESAVHQTLRGPFGTFDVRGSVPGVRAAHLRDAWLWTSIGALDHVEPYPQSSFTWRPYDVSP